MRARCDEYGTYLSLSPDETWRWAQRSGHYWPCSEIAGKRLQAAWDHHGYLVDVNDDWPGDEFGAITSDVLCALYGPDHPAIRGQVEKPFHPRKD